MSFRNASAAGLGLLALTGTLAHAQTLSVSDAHPPAMLWRAGQGLPAVPGSPLVTGDALKTGLGGGVGVEVSGRGQIDLGGASEMVVEQLPFDDEAPGAQVALRLQRGSARLLLASGKRAGTPLELRLAGQALVLGSGEHIVELASGAIRACVAEGQAELRTFEGMVRGTLPAGSCYRLDEASLVAERGVDWDALRGSFTTQAAPGTPVVPAEPPVAYAPPALPEPMPQVPAMPTPAPAIPPPPETPTVARVWDPSLNREVVTEVRPRVAPDAANTGVRADYTPPAGESQPPIQQPPVLPAYTPPPEPVRPLPPAAMPAAPAPGARSWSVIAGSFTERARAERQARKLEERGIPAAVTSKELRGQTWYRVHAGEHATEAAAASAARGLREQLGDTSIWIVPAPR